MGHLESFIAQGQGSPGNQEGILPWGQGVCAWARRGSLLKQDPCLFVVRPFGSLSPGRKTETLNIIHVSKPPGGLYAQ